MRFYVCAKGNGKTIRVVDRLAGTEQFNAFVDADNVQAVSVGSDDGQRGEVDILSRMRADAPWFAVYTDYSVDAEEIVEVNDN